MQLCIRVRKDEIIYRRAQRQRGISQREQQIQKEQERQQRQEQECAEAEAKFLEEHREEIEAVERWEAD